MEDLWKLNAMGYRLNDLAERAEYDRLVKRFHEEEERGHMNDFLKGNINLRGVSLKNTDEK